MRYERLRFARVWFATVGWLYQQRKVLENKRQMTNKEGLVSRDGVRMSRSCRRVDGPIESCWEVIICVCGGG